MPMRFSLLLMAFFVSLTSLTAQQEDSAFIARVSAEILSSGKAYENLRVLCKTVGARLSGSAGMYKAEQWGLKTLQETGAEKVYLQQCMVPHWTRGGSDEAWYTYTDAGGKTIKETLHVLALGNSMGTGKNGLKADLVYCNNFDELEQQKDNIKGKIVFFNYPFNETYLQTFRAYGEAGAYRRSGPSRAAKYGAIAIVIRSMSGSVDNYPHTGATQYDSAYPKIPCAAMGLRDADKLAGLVKDGKKIQLYYRSNAKMLADTIGHNVIAELRGSENPDEYITVGGHLDSWDPAEGANDDGAGCVHTIEVLRVLKLMGYKPKHSIRFVLFANEENGGRGGSAYANAAKTSGEKHIFALESDEGGFTPRGFGFTMPPEKLARIQSWVPLFVPYGVYQFTMGGGGSDIAPLRQLQTPLAGLTPDGSRYFDIHHAANDVLENVNKRELELGAINMTALIYMIDKYGL